MSLIDRIADGLQAMAVDLGRAQQEAAVVDRTVEQISTRADAAGFMGIATGLARVREPVGQVRARLSMTGHVLGKAVNSLAAVPQKPSPQETISALTPVASALAAVDNGIVVAVYTIEQTRQLAEAALRGGGPSSILAGLQRLDQILTSVRARGYNVRQHVEAAREQAYRVGELIGGGATGGTAVPGGMHPPPDIPQPADPAWKPVDPASLPGTVRAATGRLDPRPSGINRPTRGLLNGEPVTSGGGDRSLATDLDHDPLRGPPVTFYDHAESKAAAYMRSTGSAEADLAIDNTVCGTNERDRDYPWTCDKILPAILPAGSRLRVWVTRDGGHTWWHRVYIGTGERIIR